MRILLDKLEEKMSGPTCPESCRDVVKTLFAGTVRSYVKCLNVDYESKRDEDFYDIQVKLFYYAYSLSFLFYMNYYYYYHVFQSNLLFFFVLISSVTYSLMCHRSLMSAAVLRFTIHLSNMWRKSD